MDYTETSRAAPVDSARDRLTKHPGLTPGGPGRPGSLSRWPNADDLACLIAEPRTVIGPALRRCRHAVGLSLSHVANLTGGSERAVRRWEHSETLPTPRTFLVLIATYLLLDAERGGRTVQGLLISALQEIADPFGDVVSFGENSGTPRNGEVGGAAERLAATAETTSD